MPRIADTCTALLVTTLAGCGVAAPQHGAAVSPIIGGEAPAPGELAAVGALAHDGSGTQQVFCTATLIAETWVLTAAHCLTRVPAGAALGFFHGEDFRAAGASSAVVPVVARHAHPEFVDDPPDVLAVYFDIAVLQLSAPIAGVTPARLVRPEEAAQLVRRDGGALIVGYGLTDPAVASSKGARRKGATRIGDVGEGEFWVRGSPDPQKCAGDSGGPTFGDLDPTEGYDWRLIGVASRAGQGCQDGSAETRVDRYLDWLHTAAPIPCGSGKSAECTDPPPGPASCPGIDGGPPCGDASAVPTDLINPAPGPPIEQEGSGCAVFTGAVRASSGPWLLVMCGLCWRARRRRGARGTGPRRGPIGCG